MNTAFGQYSSGSMTNDRETTTYLQDTYDTTFYAVSIDTAATIESARTLALSKALGKALRFFNAPLVQQANTATDAQSLEKTTIQTEVYITKTEDGSFVAKVECVAKRMSLYHTIKNEFH